MSRRDIQVLGTLAIAVCLTLLFGLGVPACESYSLKVHKIDACQWANDPAACLKQVG